MQPSSFYFVCYRDYSLVQKSGNLIPVPYQVLINLSLRKLEFYTPRYCLFHSLPVLGYPNQKCNNTLHHTNLRALRYQYHYNTNPRSKANNSTGHLDLLKIISLFSSYNQLITIISNREITCPVVESPSRAGMLVKITSAFWTEITLSAFNRVNCPPVAKETWNMLISDMFEFITWTF